MDYPGNNDRHDYYPHEGAPHSRNVVESVSSVMAEGENIELVPGSGPDLQSMMNSERYQLLYCCVHDGKYDNIDELMERRRSFFFNTLIGFLPADGELLYWIDQIQRWTDEQFLFVFDMFVHQVTSLKKSDQEALRDVLSTVLELISSRSRAAVQQENLVRKHRRLMNPFTDDANVNVVEDMREMLLALVADWMKQREDLFSLMEQMRHWTHHQVICAFSAYRFRHERKPMCDALRDAINAANQTS